MPNNIVAVARPEKNARASTSNRHRLADVAKGEPVVLLQESGFRPLDGLS
jgi:hypothetical protein